MTTLATTSTAFPAKGTAAPRTALEPRESLFVSFYLQTLNGAEAARRAGFVGNCYAQATRLFRVPAIKAAIEKGYRELAPTVAEVLTRITEQARASIGDVFDIDDSGHPRINLKKAEINGKMHTIKKISYDANNNPIVEMCDSQAALLHLAKIMGMMVDKHILTGPDNGPVQVEQVRGAMELLLTNPETLTTAMDLAEKLAQSGPKKLPQNITIDATSNPA